MVMAVTVLAKKPAPPDDPRAALREAVAEAEKAREAVDRHRAAIGRAEEQVTAAEEKFTLATQAVEAARERHADALADAAGGGKTPLPSVMRAARLAAADAEDELAAARLACDRLKSSDLERIEQESLEADNAVCCAANVFLTETVERELAQAVDLQRQLFLTRAKLQGLVLDDEYPPAFPTELQRTRAAKERREAMGELRDRVWAHLNREISLDAVGIRQEFFEVDQAWRRYKIALRSDPDAEPPK
jgi:hypothetical protein